MVKGDTNCCGIAFFHQNEVENVQGGIERYLSTLLRTSGSAAVLVTERADNETRPDRITVPLVGPAFLPKWLRFNLGVLADASRIRNELHARGVKVLEFSRPEYAVFGALFPESKVFTFHGMGPNRQFVGQRLVHDLMARAMPFVADSIQIVGRDDSALPPSVRRRVGRRMVHVDAWYDERFACKPLPPVDGNPLVLFYSGRLSEQKNPRLLFAVIRACVERLPFPVRVRYFGGDTSAIESSGLAGIVECTGYLNPDRLATEIAKCHVGLLCSEQEGSPFAMIETLACGRAFVSSPVPGLMQAYSDARGVFFAESMEPAAFLTAIERARAFLSSDGDLAGLARRICEDVNDRSQGQVAQTVIKRLQTLAQAPAAALGEINVGSGVPTQPVG